LRKVGSGDGVEESWRAKVPSGWILQSATDISEDGTVITGFGISPPLPGSKETVLYSVTGGKDGGNPYAAVVQDEAGNLFGTTYQGGAFNFGTVFKLDNTGKETVLHSVTGGTDGGYPVTRLVRDSEGNYYGTAGPSTTLDFGTVFKLTLEVEKDR
jgi:uncharacterized repeat protein (TIGR03803 family)